MTETPVCSCCWKSALSLRARIPAPWHGHWCWSKAIQPPLLPQYSAQPTAITLTEIQTASPGAVVSNSHFPLVKIELGLSILPSQGDEERRCRGISLKHAAASVLMGCWQVGTNPCAHPCCFFQVSICPKQRSPVPQRGAVGAGGVHRAITAALSITMLSQGK